MCWCIKGHRNTKEYLRTIKHIKLCDIASFSIILNFSLTKYINLNNFRNNTDMVELKIIQFYNPNVTSYLKRLSFYRLQINLAVHIY